MHLEIEILCDRGHVMLAEDPPRIESAETCLEEARRVAGELEVPSLLAEERIENLVRAASRSRRGLKLAAGQAPGDLPPAVLQGCSTPQD